jgi:type VI protein secretion system component VasK
MEEIAIARRWNQYWNIIIKTSIASVVILFSFLYILIHRYRIGAYKLDFLILWLLISILFIFVVIYRLYDYTRSIKTRFTDTGLTQTTLAKRISFQWNEITTIEMATEEWVLRNKKKEKIVLYIDFFDKDFLFSLLEKKLSIKIQKI